MLDSTLDLISLAASNSLAVFCFCNLIIAILLVGSAKPSSQFEEKRPNDFYIIVDDHKFKKTGSVSFSEKTGGVIEAVEENASSVNVSITMIENEEEGCPAEEENIDDGDDDDELKKRAEEFIDKVNKGWRAERLKAYALGQ